MRFILKSNRTGLFLVNVPEKDPQRGYKAGWTRRRDRAFVFNTIDEVPTCFRGSKPKPPIITRFKKMYTLVLLNPQQQEN